MIWTDVFQCIAMFAGMLAIMIKVRYTTRMNSITITFNTVLHYNVQSTTRVSSLYT